jgi:ABC-type branched-subunit amino acid transport system permease subunit
LAVLPSVSVGRDTVACMVLPLIYVALAASHEALDARAGFANLAHSGFFALGA